MNGLFFPSQLKLINLTPFKVSVCKIIWIFLKDETLNEKTSILILLDGLSEILNEYKCEISKKYFYDKLSYIITKLVKTKQPNYSEDNDNFSNEIYIDIINELEKTYNNIHSINDLYAFFNIEIKDLKTKNENGVSFLENGGIIDNYIRKCLFAFYKMSFEDICKLFINFQLYVKGEEISIQLTTKESEILFERQIRELDRKGSEEINQKVLQNLNYKHKYYFNAKFVSNEIKENFKHLQQIGEDSINNLHKFFDYNMKYFYSDSSNADTKIHYSLMNIVEHYFDNNYFEKTIQILFECIKLNQSNCDHEGLLKCFIWMQKIYKVLGKFDIAAKCLSTCLIKSFENNFHLIYLISTSELAFLNYYFHSNIGEITEVNSINSLTFEEKILSYSNSYIHSYKNILQLLSGNNLDYVYEKNPKYYFKYVYYILILNLLKKGYSSLAISFLKKLIDYLFLTQSSYNFTQTNPNYTIETINVVLNLLIEVMEFDLSYTLHKVWEIIISNKKQNFEFIIKLIKLKFVALSGRIDCMTELIFEKDSLLSVKKNLYYTLYLKYLKFETILSQSIIQDKLQNYEMELINFKNTCKENKYQKLKLLSGILISKIYMNMGKITESIFKINKIIKKSNDKQTYIKAKLVLAEIYSKIKKILDVKLILIDLETKIDNYANINDKFNFYLLNSQLLIMESNPIIQDTLTKNIIECIKNAILLNNVEKIKLSFYLLSFQKNKNNSLLLEKANVHVTEITKLFTIFQKFNLSSIEGLELIKLIHSRNKRILCFL